MPNRPPSFPISFRALATAAAAASLAPAGGTGSAAGAAAGHDDKVAAVLARNCLECHAGAGPEGDLDLSSPDGIRSVVAARDLAGSELWTQVESGEMPKKRPALGGKDLAALREWILAGAEWERGPIDPFAYSSPRRAGYDWWSLQPVADPAPPAVGDEGARWARHDIDRFVWRALEERGLKPSPEVSRHDLIRRVSFDLTGLPPTPEEVSAFVADESPDAYGRLVDRLMASPQYGVRQARLWLDVVRFGESQGFERNRIREHAWLYRDWVVGAFNSDLPYDQFVRLQVAGDVLRPGELGPLLATGYHVCGTWDQVGHIEGSQAMQAVVRADHMEDLVGTLGQAFLGLTVQCARCHDHKFDPVTQADYYRVASALSGVRQEEKEREGIDAASPGSAELAGLQRELAELRQALRAKYFGPPHDGARVVEGLVAHWDFRAGGDPNRFGPQLGEGGDGTAPRHATPAPATEVAEAAAAAGTFSVELRAVPGAASQAGPARVLTFSKDSSLRNFTIGQDGEKWDVRFRTTSTDANGQPGVAGGKVELRPTHVVFVFQPDGEGVLYVDGAEVARRVFGGDLGNWDRGFRIGIGDEFTGGRRWEGEVEMAALYAGALTPEDVRHHFEADPRQFVPAPEWAEVADKLSPEERERHGALTKKVTELAARAPFPQFAGRAHVPFFREPEVTHVLGRGDVTRPGDAVGAGGVAAVRGGADPDFALPPDAPEAERRRKLADWLAHPNNPLTARVMANRLWHWRFGTGIVDTPSDFGFNGGQPSHPALLDFLTRQLRDSGWSIKALDRAIVTSAAYRQSTDRSDATAEAADADGRLLWRFPLRRLEGEAVRDALLAASGALNLDLGGPSYHDLQVGLESNNQTFGDPLEDFGPASNRRSLYRLWARSGNHPMLEAFDCPDPSVAAPRRTRTVTPLQALALLHSPLSESCARALADRIGRGGAEVSSEAAVREAYRAVLLRAPDAAELAEAERFVEEHGIDQLALVLFNSNEFLYVR